MTIVHGEPDESEEQRALARSGLLEEASWRLSATLDLDTTLRSIVGLVVPALADGCVVQLLGAGIRTAPERERPQFEQLVVAHADRAIEQRVHPLLGDRSHLLHRSFGPLEVVRTGLPQLVDDLEREPEPSLMRELAAASYLSLPLRAHGPLLGVLTLVRCDPARTLRSLDSVLVEELSKRASVAIENARLYGDAQRAIAVRDDMLALVSHDLQSPLNAISMTVRRLLDDAQVVAIPGAKRSLALLERTTKHIGQLIAELLEVGSIQAGRLALEPRPTQLAPLLAEALAILEPLVQEKQLRITSHIAPDLPAVYCDGKRILRVLMNLLGNAIKFSADGGEAAVRLRRVDEQAEVSIQDTGPGIAHDDLPKLFQPYWRSRQAGRRGMGLGLYIARGIIEAHGGHIWAESELGVGSTFVFRLAFAAAEHTSRG
jgi:signal transduction histidine kinase